MTEKINNLEDKQPESEIKSDNTKSTFKKKVLHKLAESGLFFLELVKVGILAGITIIVIRHFLFKPFYVRGASMEPNFYDKEYLIIDELSYRFRAPERGEVLVFKYLENPSEYFLKRIIGLPGERIKISAGTIKIYNQEYPDGVELNEKYLPNNLKTDGDQTITIKNDQYFVLGDNRPNSYDSRRFGTINKKVIVGRVLFRGWPFNRAEIIKKPTYN